jgi:NAD-dependent deacetylase
MTKYQELSVDSASTYLQKTKRCLVLTGAGISVASGLPVYRGMQGSLYDNPDQLREAMASTLHKDPAGYWRRHAQRRAACASVKPNPGHRALVELERGIRNRDGECQFLLATQNIDNLHRRAGQREVVELHGNVFKLRCIDFRCSYKERDEIDPDLVANAALPLCKICGQGMRPDLVLFGEGDDSRWQRLRDFVKLGLDLLIFIGSSGTVTVPESLIQMVTELGHAPYIMDINPGPVENSAFIELIHGRLTLKSELALPALIDRLGMGIASTQAVH